MNLNKIIRDAPTIVLIKGLLAKNRAFNLLEISFGISVLELI